MVRCSGNLALPSAGKKKPDPRERGPVLIGRSRVIRTLDPLLPKQVRYQAALYSVMIRDDGIRRVASIVVEPRHVAMRRFIAALPAAFKRLHHAIFLHRAIIAKRQQTV